MAVLGFADIKGGSGPIRMGQYAFAHPFADGFGEFSQLLQRLGDDVPEVVALMGPYPIDAPPRFLRATVAVYRFTEPGSDAAAEGQWWERSTPRTYCPVVRVPGR